MKTKYLALCFLTIALSCSEEEMPCQLAGILISGPGISRETVYTYKPSGQLDRMIRTSNGNVILDNTYSYNQNGNVDKIEMLDSNWEFEYLNGKLTVVNQYSKEGTMIGQDTYSWQGDNFEMQHRSVSKPNLEKTEEYEYLNGNVVKRTFSYFTGDEPNEMWGKEETVLEDFDTALSAFYVSTSARPGYALGISKNNPRKETIHSLTLFEGTWSEYNAVTIYSYTYNASNATISSRSEREGIVTDTWITYNSCK